MSHRVSPTDAATFTSSAAVDAAVRKRAVRDMTRVELHEAVKLDLPLCRMSSIEASIARLRRSGELVSVEETQSRRVRVFRLVRRGDA